MREIRIVATLKREGEDLVLQSESNRSWYIRTGDKQQARYELLKLAELAQASREELCEMFGLNSRQSYYDYRKKYPNSDPQARIGALQEVKTGPKDKTRCTREVEKRIVRLRHERSELNMYEIADELRKEGITIGDRTVARTLSEFGILKKTKKQPMKDS